MFFSVEIRFPSNKNDHPSGGEKWHQDLSFHYMNVQGVPLFAGDMYTYHHNPETGKEKHGILKRFIDDVNVCALITCPCINMI